MTAPIWIPMPGNEYMARRLSALIGGEIAELEFRRFPDEESYLRLNATVSGRTVAIVCTLDRPDAKFLPLAFTAAMARDLGASQIGLIAPYLGYMRQDRRFKSGEAITSRYFAHLISGSFNWLITAEPHLHRYASLDEIYHIPNEVARATNAISQWVRSHVQDPVIVGPDSESTQWVGSIAADGQWPYAVLSKQRVGDLRVKIEIPDMSAWQEYQPVLIDDAISSAATMIEATNLLISAGMRKPICVGVHGLFAGDSYRLLRESAARIVTTNTVTHVSNEIDLSQAIACATKKFAQ